MFRYLLIFVCDKLLYAEVFESSLGNITYNWDGDNFTFYNDSLLLMMNFDNVSTLGENDTYVVDHSKYGNNGTDSGGSVVNTTDCKFGNCRAFDGGFFHLLINCLMIWFAGRQIEQTLGKPKFLSLYLIAGVLGGLLQCALSWVGFLPPAGVVGASAGVSGLIAAFAMLLWNRELTFLIMFIIPVTMRAKYLLLVLVVIDVAGLAAGGTGIAHGAHLGGVMWGVLFVLLFVQGGTWNGAEPLWERLKDRFNMGRERRVVTIDGGARAYSRNDSGSESVAEASFVEAEIDPILDKISKNGIQSLNDRERLILEQARKKMGR